MIIWGIQKRGNVTIYEAATTLSLRRMTLEAEDWRIVRIILCILKTSMHFIFNQHTMYLDNVTNLRTQRIYSDEIFDVRLLVKL